MGVDLFDSFCPLFKPTILVLQFLIDLSFCVVSFPADLPGNGLPISVHLVF